MALKLRKCLERVGLTLKTNNRVTYLGTSAKAAKHG